MSPVQTRYTAERRSWDWLRDTCPEAARRDYEQAIRTLVERYNTTIYENRFIVGGAVEVFTWALLRSAGIDCTLYGDQAKAGDILLPGDRKLSVKGTFTGGLADVKLVNQLGEGERAWDAATLFVCSDVGIVFGAPDMVADTHVKATGDGLILKKAALRALADDPANVLALDIARKPPTVAAGFSLKASTAVARQILREQGLAALERAIPETVERAG